MALMRAILAVFIIGIACSSYSMGQDSETVTDPNPSDTSIVPILLASTWTVEEHTPASLFNGRWIRRPGTNTFDASWNGGSIKDVIDITSVEGNTVVLHRHQNNGNYTGTISSDGNSILGTASWYKPGSGWSATVSPILLASTWIVEEHTPTSLFNGRWIRRPGTNTFDASWNGGSIKDVINIASVEGNTIVLHRHQNNGNYTGTISSDGNSILGTASWYKPGSGWSASVPGSKINYDQLKSLIRPGDIIYGSENIKGTKIPMFPSHIAIIIRGKNDKGEDDLMVREAYLVKGVSNISLKDFCECGGYHKEPKTISNIFDNYDNIKILRAKCSNEQAEKAAEEAIKIRGQYDLSYFTGVVDLVASISHGMALTQAIKSATNLKSNWDNPNKWYCSELVYKAYLRAGFDLFPKKGKCISPLALLFKKNGEYPHLDVGIPLLEDGKCPWCLITPEHVLKSKYVQEIWSWKKQ